MKVIVWILALLLPVSFATAAQSTRTGGTLVYALADEPDRLDPNLSGTRPAQIVFFQIFDPLIVRDKRDKSFKPWLATSWSVSPDGRAYTFTLRHGVTFQDGTPFNAAAVKFNMDRTHDPKLATQCAGCAVGFYVGTDVIDASTVRIRLNRPWAPFLDSMSLFYKMVSPAAVNRYGNQDFGRNPVGSGPFKFVEWIPNDHITLERNAGYNWAPSIMQHSGPAYLDRLIFRSIPEDGTRVAALEDGEVQVIDNAPAQDFDRLTKDSTRFQPLLGYVPGVPFIYAVDILKPPTDELAVRQAINYGIDRRTIAATVFGPFQKYKAFLPAFGPLTPYTYAYDKGAALYAYNPTKAKALLSAAGWLPGPDGIRQKAGQRLTIVLASREHGVPEVVQAQLLQVGMEVQVLIQNGSPGANENQRKMVSNLGSSAAPRSDPDILSALLHSRNFGGNGFNFAFVKNPELDQLLDAQAVESNPAKRAAILSSVQRLIMEEAYWAPIYDWDNVSLRSAKVNDLVFDNVGFFPWVYDAWLQR